MAPENLTSLQGKRLSALAVNSAKRINPRNPLIRLIRDSDTAEDIKTRQLPLQLNSPVSNIYSHAFAKLIL